MGESKPRGFVLKGESVLLVALTESAVASCLFHLHLSQVVHNYNHDSVVRIFVYLLECSNITRSVTGGQVGQHCHKFVKI